MSEVDTRDPESLSDQGSEGGTSRSDGAAGGDDAGKAADGGVPSPCPSPPTCSLGDTTTECCGDYVCTGGGGSSSSGSSSGSSGSSGGSSSGSGEVTCQYQVCALYTCALVNGCATWTGYCETPLVLSFDGARVQYRVDPSRTFLLGAEVSTTDWPTAATPWLALDRNGNGRIDDGSELFGSMTRIRAGGRASNGFEALRDLDADGDGLLTERDPAFAHLVLWSDGDGDRSTGPGELVSLSEAGVLSIDLHDRPEPHCDARGNCEVERAPFLYRDASGLPRTGSVVDVHLAAH